MAKHQLWIDVYYTGKDGWMGEEQVPATWGICERCEGEGKHGNPAFDGMSYPGDWDPEFWEGYFEGHYDVRCDECRGTGKVLVPEYENPEQEQAHYNALQEQYNHEALVAAERRMGA